MQLVAYGAQDAYLSGNPQITFFKVVYRRHTNFSVEPIQQTWNGAPDFGRTVTCNLSRNGDLITNTYVAVKLNEVTPDAVPWGYVNRIGHAMLENVKVEIGGSKIDEQYGDWLNIWWELTHKVGQERGYNKMIGNVSQLTDISTTTKPSYQLYVPLQFWFNRNNGLALPLIALQYHDVRLTLTFRKALDCVNWQGTTTNPPASTNLPSMQDSYLLIDYVYLDSEERKRFAQASHEYLIEQLQFTGAESLSNQNNKYRLNFNHPSKYLVWVAHLDRYLNRNEWLAHSVDGNWGRSSDRFAKLLYLASRKNLSENASTVVAPGTTTSWDLYVDPGSGGLSAGDMFEPAAATGLNSAVSAMLAKVEVKCVCQADQNVGGGEVHAKLAELIGIASNSAKVNEVLNNMIVVRNDLTMEDLSKTASELVSPSSGNGLNSVLVSMSTVSVVSYFNYGNFVDGTDNPVYNAKLQLNGQDRFQNRDGHYFNYVQPFQHFSNTPSDGVNVYSFALKAEDHQPTGTCNFSRIDNATLQVDVGLRNTAPKDNTYANTYIGSGSGSLMHVYTQSYNVLRIMSGMGGVAYSN
jgi:hypothetical protein